MAKVKAKSQKNAVKAKPTAKKGAAKPAPKSGAKVPAGKTNKPVSKAKTGKKAPVKAAPSKKVVAQKPPAKPAPKKAIKAPAPKPKAAVPVKKPASPSKVVPAKAQPTAPPAKPTVPVKAATEGKPGTEKSVSAPAPKADAAPKAASAKDTKPKAPVVAVMTGLDPLGTPARTLKRPVKERFSVEFYMNATPGSLYDMISSPSGLSEWFCDDVDVRGDHFTFRWGNDDQTAQCLSRKFGELMRFQWEDEEDQGAYFELRIRVDPMTNETCLVVTDHAWPKDLDDAKALWGSQIHALQRVLGA